MILLSSWPTHRLFSCVHADSDATHFLSKSEVTRARVALVGFCLQCVVAILSIIVLGDDGEEAAWGTEARDPLVSGQGQATATTPL